MFFDLTQLQLIARDGCAGDAICFFECCHGDVMAMDRARTRSSDTKIMETLAAGRGPIYVGDKSLDFSRRFASDLRQNRGPDSVRESFRRVGSRHHWNAPGYYRRDKGKSKSSIVLQPIP